MNVQSRSEHLEVSHLFRYREISVRFAKEETESRRGVAFEVDEDQYLTSLRILVRDAERNLLPLCQDMTSQLVRLEVRSLPSIHEISVQHQLGPAVALRATFAAEGYSQLADFVLQLPSSDVGGQILEWNAETRTLELEKCVSSGCSEICCG